MYIYLLYIYILANKKFGYKQQTFAGTKLGLEVRGGRNINKKTTSSLGEYLSHDLKQSYSYQVP